MKTANDRYWRQDQVAQVFAEFENNFGLSPTPGLRN